MADTKKGTSKDKPPEKPKPSTSAARVVCPTCGGRTWVSYGTEDSPCATCNATGYVKG